MDPLGQGNLELHQSLPYAISIEDEKSLMICKTDWMENSLTYQGLPLHAK